MTTLADPGTVEIREAGAADLARLSLVGRATFLETYADTVQGEDVLRYCDEGHSADAYAALLREAGARAWLAETAAMRAPVGYVLVMRARLPHTTPDDLEVRRLNVLHRYHGRRLGRELLQRAIDAARAAGAVRLVLGVYSVNGQALAFYERMGFVRIGGYQFHVGERAYDDYVVALWLRD